MSVWEIVAPINFIDNFWITNCYDQFQLFLNVFWSKWHNGPHKKKNASIISNKFLDKQLFVVLLHILGFLRQDLTITVKILQFRYFALYRMYLFDINANGWITIITKSLFMPIILYEVSMFMAKQQSDIFVTSNSYQSFRIILLDNLLAMSSIKMPRHTSLSVTDATDRQDVRSTDSSTSPTNARSHGIALRLATTVEAPILRTSSCPTPPFSPTS